MKRYAKLYALILAVVMMISIIPTTPFLNSVEAKGIKDANSPRLKVDHTTYGWALDNAINADGIVSVKIMEVPGFEVKEYSTAISLAGPAHTNPITKASRAEALAGGIIAKNNFVEIHFNADNECIDMDVIEYGGNNANNTYMDSASYGGELTAKDGTAGNMVAMGWILDKDIKNPAKSTITIGDGNHVVNLFEETYTLAPDAKVFTVDNYGTWEGTISTFADIKLTAKGTDGEIYYTPERWTAVCVFDKNYKVKWENGAAMVQELYLFKTPVKLTGSSLYTPSGLTYDGLSWMAPISKNLEKPGYTYAGACESIELMKDRLYDVGDAYTDVYLFISDDGAMSLLDQGNRNASYQYWLNIAKLGYDPRKVDNIMLTHGHGDHYQALYENIRMIRRAGENVKIYINSYAQGATISNAEASFSVGPTLTDKPVLSLATDVLQWDTWSNAAGQGVSMYPWRGIGHSNDTANFVFKTTAKDSDSYFKEGDVVSWIYHGGYGAVTSVSNGVRVLQIVNNMQYQQAVIGPWAKAQSDYVYPLSQHTNQFPQHEIALASQRAGIPFAQGLVEGLETNGNFLERRISLHFYKYFTTAYEAKTDTLGNILEAAGTGFRCASSASGHMDTIQANGPYKRPDGTYTITVQAVSVIHGFDAFVNQNQVFADQENIYGFTLDQGFVIDKDSYVHDPDGWYVEIIGRVDDGYKGGLNYDENFYKGQYVTGKNNTLLTAPWTSGPIEMSNRPESWSEILRTVRLETREQAEAFAEALTNGAYAETYQTYSTGGVLYAYGDTGNHSIDDFGKGAGFSSAKYTVKMNKASEILVGSSFADTFMKADK